MLLYQRYFLKEFFKIFFLILISFYGLYILIDYSSHASLFHQRGGWFSVVSYYGAEFIQRLEVLVPFAVAASSVKTLTTFNQHHELAALLAAGVPLKKLLRPFLAVALCIGVLLTLSSEWIQPAAHKQLRYFTEKRKHEKHQKAGIVSVQLMPLEGAPPLFYQGYDRETQALKDVYWIRSLDDVVHIQKLYALEGAEPRGKHVDFLKRNMEGELIPVRYEEEAYFPDMALSKKSIIEMTTLPNELSLTELWRQLTPEQDILNEKEAQIRTTFYYKLILPWLSLLVVLGCMPLCVRFSRQQNLLFLYAGTLFGLIAFYLALGSALILGERQVVAPALALWPLFGGALILLGSRYWRLC